ncbi:MAG: tRNA dihydrouridine synthase DusB [Deltaproteobacteria bacterium]|nr:tRNA dihydrouridine synthase DusB [Deltaproteobacteria bacterium]
MRIGGIQLEVPFLLAPMAGFTDSAFRLLTRKFGCGLAFTEMVSSNGVVQGHGRTLRYLHSNSEERPLAVQLFGSNPEILAGAASIAQKLGADIIDLNVGCPVRKVTKGGSGAALLKDLNLLGRILRRVRREVDCPFTVKTRAGWDPDHLTYLEVGRMADQEGVDAVTLHPRTAGQFFSGAADWSMIERLKREIGIPVIGNGDIQTPHQALEMMHETGCDAVMIGRSAVGNPWFFREARALMEGRIPAPVSLDEREETIRFHYELLKDVFGAKRAARKLRGHIMYYTRGLPSSSDFRGSIGRVTDEEPLFAALAGYFGRVAEGAAHEG